MGSRLSGRTMCLDNNRRNCKFVCCVQCFECTSKLVSNIIPLGCKVVHTHEKRQLLPSMLWVEGRASAKRQMFSMAHVKTPSLINNELLHSLSEKIA